jgi:diguanylate cyclase (GGDEF)-like protein
LSNVNHFNWQRLSIGARLMVIVALNMAALALVGTLAVRALGDDIESTKQLSRASRAQHFQQDADMYHDGLRAYVYAAALAGDYEGIDTEQVLADLQVDSQTFRSDLEALAHLDTTPEVRRSVEQSRPLAEAYIEKANDIAVLTLTDRPAALARLADLDESFRELRDVMDRQTKLIEAEIAAADRDALAIGGRAQSEIVLAALGTALVVAVVVALLVRSIRNSLRRVRDTARAIADGNLNVPTTVATHDELGELTTAIDRMAGSLRTMIDKLRTDASRDAFGAQVAGALDMADTEPEAHAAVARAMSFIATDRPMELLLADSSRAQLERAAQHPTAGAPRCGVGSPFGCIAVRRGNPVTFADSEALNACPRLRDRPAGALSAVCVPLTFMGRSLGVLHVTGPQRQLPTDEQIAQLETLGMQAGARIGTVRAFQRTQQQATTDSLTGLPNRRALEEFVLGLAKSGKPYALVTLDLDHFKRLNDTHGHHAGDRALCTFAEVMRKSLRGGDFAARWGGEEFSIVIPGATAAAAVLAVERLRTALAETLTAAGTTVFTLSAGVADTTMTQHFDELVRIADEALYRSKAGGRDRATIGDPALVDTPAPRHDTERNAAIDLNMLASS